MARTNPKPLSIMVHDDEIWNSQEFKDLLAKGHTAIQEGFSDEVDVEIGRKCWRIDPALGNLEKQLQMMVDGVRAVKYPKKKETTK